jgi:hypothetical protein
MIAKIRSLSFILILMSSAAALAGQPQSYVGTWLTTVTPPAEAGVPPFTLLLTLHADGNLLASGTSGEFPALGNPCHGTWSGNASGVRATYVCLDFDGSLQQTGMDVLSASFNVDDKRGLTGKIGLANFDVLGQPVFDACCATIAGQKIEVDDAKPLEPFAKSMWRMGRR